MEIDLTVAYVAGGVAFVTSLVTSFLGPVLLETRKQLIEERILWGPSKALLKELLDNAAENYGRSFKTIKRVTGLPDDDIRRLLVGLGARGFTRDNGDEAWCYKKQRPLQQQVKIASQLEEAPQKAIAS